MDRGEPESKNWRAPLHGTVTTVRFYGTVLRYRPQVRFHGTVLRNGSMVRFHGTILRHSPTDGYTVRIYDTFLRYVVRYGSTALFNGNTLWRGSTVLSCGVRFYGATLR